MEASCKRRAQLVFQTGEHNFVAVLSVTQTWKLLPCWVGSFCGVVVQLATKLCVMWPNFPKSCGSPVLRQYINMLCHFHPFLAAYPWSKTDRISDCLVWHCAINSLSREDHCSANCSPEQLMWLCFDTWNICVDASSAHTNITAGLYFPDNTDLGMGGLSCLLLFPQLIPLLWMLVEGGERERTAGEWSYLCFSCWTLNFWRCSNDTQPYLEWAFLWFLYCALDAFKGILNNL